MPDLCKDKNILNSIDQFKISLYAHVQIWKTYVCLNNLGILKMKNYARDTVESGMLLVRINSDSTITIEAIANAVDGPANPTFSSCLLYTSDAADE